MIWYYLNAHRRNGRSAWLGIWTLRQNSLHLNLIMAVEMSQLQEILMSPPSTPTLTKDCWCYCYSHSRTQPVTESNGGYSEAHTGFGPGCPDVLRRPWRTLRRSLLWPWEWGELVQRFRKLCAQQWAQQWAQKWAHCKGNVSQGSKSVPFQCKRNMEQKVTQAVGTSLNTFPSIFPILRLLNACRDIFHP